MNKVFDTWEVFCRHLKLVHSRFMWLPFSTFASNKINQEEIYVAHIVEIAQRTFYFHLHFLMPHKLSKRCEEFAELLGNMQRAINRTEFSGILKLLRCVEWKERMNVTMDILWLQLNSFSTFLTSDAVEH